MGGETSMCSTAGRFRSIANVVSRNTSAWAVTAAHRNSGSRQRRSQSLSASATSTVTTTTIWVLASVLNTSETLFQPPVRSAASSRLTASSTVNGQVWASTRVTSTPSSTMNPSRRDTGSSTRRTI
ncbi:hypothetical protein NKG94_38100 [Micromonospora sp. M12]